MKSYKKKSMKIIYSLDCLRYMDMIFLSIVCMYFINWTYKNDKRAMLKRRKKQKLEKNYTKRFLFTIRIYR